MIYDFCVVGGGIVGLATAYELVNRHPRARIVLIEKESALARHQSSHNSGVIHSGIYYKPGSLKADLCRHGLQWTERFCETHGIAYERRGKLVVATNDLEVDRLYAIEENARNNEVVVKKINKKDLAVIEPNICGEAALLVPSTGIVDYSEICAVLGELIAAAGVETIFNAEVNSISESVDSVVVGGGQGRWMTRQLILCAGLQADRLAELSGMQISFRIVPFRGEFYKTHPEKANLVNHLIYPVPDPALPFLGIHLTPTIGGDLTIGPNAVLSFAREGYGRHAWKAEDIYSFLSFSGFWRTAAKHWRSGAAEMSNSLFKRVYLKQCQKYCPDLKTEDLLPHRAGIRAQAVMADGTLLHDFLFLRSPRILHVGSAPSPAATSAMPIAEMIVNEAAKMRQLVN